MSKLRMVLGLGALLALSACGAMQQLTPAQGAALPIKPATSPTQPSAPDLLTEQTTTKPGRSDELLVKSQARADDRFDLPPH
jgi:hypothetical protein